MSIGESVSGVSAREINRATTSTSSQEYLRKQTTIPSTRNTIVRSNSGKGINQKAIDSKPKAMFSSLARQSVGRSLLAKAVQRSQLQLQQTRSVVSVKKALVKAGETEEPEDVPALSKRMEAMSEKDGMMIFDSGIDLPAPVLPDNKAEVSSLDASYKTSVYMPDGRERMVVIKQMRARPNQNPLNPEKYWKISFDDDGAVGERWKNTLMNWNSTADTYGCDPPLFFKNAEDAVYFAEKRGWKYLVNEPVIRKMRNDGAQYQDNFLPQAIAGKIKREGSQCDHWKRKAAGSSHYFRPLKFHGDGCVRQHGPNMHDKTVPHAESYYKIR
jgi:hypothetical protein